MQSAIVRVRPRLSAVAVLAFLAVVLSAPAAGAHPYLVQTLPGAGAIVQAPPGAIEIGFTEAVILDGSSLRLIDPDGGEVDLGPLRTPEGGPGLAADVEGTVEAAVYTVRWVVLGDDSHTSSGEFQFGLATPDGQPPPGAEKLSATGGPADQAPEADGPVRVILRWAGLLGAAVLLGGAVLATRLRGRLEPEADTAFAGRLTALTRVAWVLALIGSVAAALAAAAAGVGSASLEIALASSTGTLAVARVVGVVATGLPALFMRAGPTRDNLFGLAGAIFLGAEAAGGHLTGLTSGRLPAGIIQAIHLAAGGLWVGGLITLAWGLAGVPREVRAAARRAAGSAFGPLALVAAAAVVVTGTVAAVREVQYRHFLLWSTYGRLVLLKVALVAGMLIFGGLVFRAVRHRAAAGRTGAMASSGLLRSEAVLGVAVLFLAATLAGVAQGRGQPLPAQRGSVLAGPAFANAVVGGGLARLVLSPASPGDNRVSVLMTGQPGEAGASGAPESVEVSLTCACADAPVTAELTSGPGAWHGDVSLPAEGVWQASVSVNGDGGLAPVALRVEEEGAPGAPPVVIAGTADLSGPSARRCRSFQLGLLLSLGLLNADGGVGGRKVVVESADDRGDPARAAELAGDFAERGAAVAVPCGRAGAAAGEILAREVPVIVADAQTPVFAGEGVFRLAGDPYAEGWAVGRIVATNAFKNRPDVPRRVAVLSDAGDVSAERAVAGLRDALALDPAKAEASERGRAEDTSDVEIVVSTREPGAPLYPLVQAALDPRRIATALLRSDPAELGPALEQLTAEELAGPAGVFVPGSHFDEAFYRASRLGRRGDIVALGEVAPDGGESLLYTRLVFALFPGEQPTIDGLRGYMAGQAIIEALEGGASSAEIDRRLRPLGPFSDSVATGWSPAAPAAGSWRLFAFKGTFIPGGLQPGIKPEAGRFFPEGGAWSRVSTANIGLCGPQEEFAGPAPPCDQPARDDGGGEE